MKKKIFTLTALLMLICVGAQELKAPKDKDAPPEKKTSIGALAGFNYASVTNPQGGTSLVSYHIGMFAEFPVTAKFSIQPEVLYSGQGLKVVNGAFYLNYINIPVLAKYYVTESFSLEAGPQLGFLASAKAKAISGGTEDVSNAFNNIDFGLNFGVGYNIDKNALIHLAYYAGFSQLQKDLEENQPASRNSVFQFSVGYRF